MSVNCEEETSAVLDKVGNQVIDRTKTELYGGIQCDCQEEKDALMGQKTLNVVWPIKNTQRGGIIGKWVSLLSMCWVPPPPH